MLERKHQKVAPLPIFIKRLAVTIGISGLLIVASLFLGIAGYHWIAGLGVCRT